jgi:hypothetical protein
MVTLHCKYARALTFENFGLDTVHAQRPGAGNAGSALIELSTRPLSELMKFNGKTSKSDWLSAFAWASAS